MDPGKDKIGRMGDMKEGDSGYTDMVNLVESPGGLLYLRLNNLVYRKELGTRCAFVTKGKCDEYHVNLNGNPACGKLHLTDSELHNGNYVSVEPFDNPLPLEVILYLRKVKTALSYL